ncbi:caspase family protein [Phormidium sp. CCY1219]|uniref:caspase family protein n=1 Tax=Phormidium sp. CCY1219 TaxID=2886104 RepID=UPI002D1EE211|nr:caspase family protein [Phormidium sp. CCY1219]MEB3828774.1 caspase family protein [Phormidium sp. CCY1219]
MGNIKRRHFLQGAGAALAALGWDHIGIQRQGLSYAKVLAQDTPRKLALLVGINDYSAANITPLRGCMTDVHLQRELLIHRFGFHPQDIVSVTDDTEIKPTRAGILEAVENHLIKQAKPGDVVVFHFSGHGSQVVNPYNRSGNVREKLNSTFVPSDRTSQVNNQQPTVSDIMGATLFLWMSAINTEQITTVLDSCHSGGGKRGNLTIRALQGGEYPSEEEIAYHQQWISQLELSRDTFIQARERGVAKGVVIASAGAHQLAADAPFDGFFAGAFTYLLTQYLWQHTGDRAVKTVLANVARSTTRLSSTQQIPEMEVKPGSNHGDRPSYFLEAQSLPAEAVINSVEGDDRFQLWLGGIDPHSFAAFDRTAVFAVAEGSGEVQIESRQGLFARAKAIAPSPNLQPGTLLQEKIRAIPANLTLKIGLDESLGEDRETAKAAIAQLDRIEPLALGQTQVHYIFGRMTEALQAQLQQSGVAEIPPVGSVGLYGAGLDAIPGSFGEAGEPVAEACDRLKAKFRALLAARIVKLTLNAESSRLNVSAALKVVQGTQTEFAATAFTPRSLRNLSQSEKTAANPPSGTIATVAGIPQLPIGTQVQCEIANGENRDLYVTLLVVTTTGELVVVFPNSWTAGIDAAIVKAGETRTIPDRDRDAFQLTVGGPGGSAEVLAIATLAPLRDSLQQLQAIAAARGTREGALVLEEESVNAVDGLLTDLDRAVRSTRNLEEESVNAVDGLLTDLDLAVRSTRNLIASFDPRSRVAGTEQLASLSITYAVV